MVDPGSAADIHRVAVAPAWIAPAAPRNLRGAAGFAPDPAGNPAHGPGTRLVGAGRQIGVRIRGHGEKSRGMAIPFVPEQKL